MDYKIINNHEYYDVYIDGKFFCFADTEAEARCEVETENINMNKYEVIKKIMESNIVSEDDKVYHIEMFLKGWSTQEDLKWIWE